MFFMFLSIGKLWFVYSISEKFCRVNFVWGEKSDDKRVKLVFLKILGVKD